MKEKLIAILLYRIDYSWPAAIFQSLFVILAGYLLVRIPSPGIAVAFLGVAAVVMAVRGTRFRRTEEVVWILIASTLCYVEIRAIQTDQFRRDTEQAAIRDEESQRFQATMTQAQKIIGSLAENINSVTGGDGYCYFTLTRTGEHPTLVHQGKYPLYDVEARFVDNAVPFVLTPESLSRSTLKIGNLSKESAELIMNAKIPFRGPEKRLKVNIFFGARNGFWYEKYKGQLVQGKWREAIQVFRQESPKDKKLLEKVDPEFPGNSKGAIDWN